MEFLLGDYQQELGIVARAAVGRGPADPVTPDGVVAYWHVDDVDATLERLSAMGARVYEPKRDFGGFIAAAVLDPFGNILGVIYNPQYLGVLRERGARPE